MASPRELLLRLLTVLHDEDIETVLHHASKLHEDRASSTSSGGIPVNSSRASLPQSLHNSTSSRAPPPVKSASRGDSGARVKLIAVMCTLGVVVSSYQAAFDAVVVDSSQYVFCLTYLIFAYFCSIFASIMA